MASFGADWDIDAASRGLEIDGLWVADASVFPDVAA